MKPAPYIGRFAPSPTGPLHFGSLVAAVASYCDAKANDGKWLVRLEDLDKLREVPGAAAHILQTLVDFGLKWDGEVVYQSRRSALYEVALNTLKAKQHVYPCQCSRKTIQANASKTGIEGAIYPNTCLSNAIHDAGQPSNNWAWRMKTAGITLDVTDSILANETQAIDQLFGDFVVKRADQLFAYQLAVVVDDAAQGISHIVRGADLWQSTSRQMLLQQALHYPMPTYAHVPIITNRDGQKLSKQTLASAINPSYASELLFAALQLLNQAPPRALIAASASEVLEWGVQHWQLSKLPNSAIMLDDAMLTLLSR